MPFDVKEVLDRARQSSPSTVAPSAFSTSPEISLPPMASSLSQAQVTPAIAAGNGSYLVAWKEFIPSTHSTLILAARVRASDGVVLDSAPIFIDSQSAPSFSVAVNNPAVAFDGSNFLVVYTQELLGNAQVLKYVLGKRVRASDGAVLDSSAISISTLPKEQQPRNPTVAFNGSYYLVLWEGWSSSAWKLLGGYVLPSGQVLSQRFEVTAAAFNPALAAGAVGDSLGVWSESPSGRIRVGWFYSNAPQALRFFTVTESGGSTPSIAYDGTHYLVVWNEAGGVVKGRRVKLSHLQGQPSSDTSFTVGTGATSPAVVSADSQSFRVTYEATRDGTPQLVSTRVLPDGAVAPNSEQTLSALHPDAGAERPAFASLGPAQKLVAYKQFDTTAGYARIQVRLVSDVRDAVCTTGQPTVFLNGAATVNLECGMGPPYGDAGARAYDGCGYPLTVTSSGGANTSLEGTYSISYAASDTTGSAQATRTVVVADSSAPVLILKGAAFSTHACGSEWVDPGVFALDACSGDLAAQLEHTGEVNGWVEGTYTITYTVTDGAGLSATPVTRTVEVVDCPE